MIKSYWMGLAFCVLSASAQDLSTFRKVQSLFNSQCITCHAGSDAAAGMSLEEGQSFKNLINIVSVEEPELKRIAPNSPENSYLYRKIVGDASRLPYHEERMPLDGDPLSPEWIATVRDWINSFPAEIWGSPSTIASGPPASTPGRQDFLATQLINLPTTRVLGSKTAEFRIMHRFGQINGGPGGGNTYGSFFGLDNGAITSIQMAVALNDQTDLLVRRTGAYKDVEVAVKWVPFHIQGKIPLTAGLYTSLDWISRDDAGGKNKFSPNVQLLLAGRVTETFTVLLAPSAAFRSNHNPIVRKEVTDSTSKLYEDTRATTAIGIGLQYEMKPDMAFTGEYVPRLSGYKGNAFSSDRRFDTWSLGFAYKIRLHVFELLLSNSQYIHTTQYIPGSSSINKNTLYQKGWNFHFGFNIYRQFKW